MVRIDDVPIGSIVMAPIDGLVLAVKCVRRYWGSGTGVLRVCIEDGSLIGEAKNTRRGSLYVDGDVLVEVVSEPGEPIGPPVVLDPLLVGDDGGIFKKGKKDNGETTD